MRELRLALQEGGRRLGAFLRHRDRLAEAAKKQSYIQSYIPHIGIALREILELTGPQEAKVVAVLTETLEIASIWSSTRAGRPAMTTGVRRSSSRTP